MGSRPSASSPDPVFDVANRDHDDEDVGLQIAERLRQSFLDQVGALLANLTDLVDVAVTARTKPHAGDPATVTSATSGWLCAHASRPPPVAIAVESPVTTMRTGRESAVGSGGNGIRVDGGGRRDGRGRRRRSSVDRGSVRGGGARFAVVGRDDAQLDHRVDRGEGRRGGHVARARPVRRRVQWDDGHDQRQRRARRQPGDRWPPQASDCGSVARADGTTPRRGSTSDR